MEYIIANKLNMLHIGKLMAVYEDDNYANGARRYPNISSGEQLLRAEQDFYGYLEEFFQTLGAFYVVSTKEKDYICALRMEPYKEGLLLEGLETRPDLRRKGYAEALVRYSLQLAEKVAPKVYAHVSKKNLPSLELHKKCGFKKTSDLSVYIDGSVNADCYTLCYTFHNE